MRDHAAAAFPLRTSSTLRTFGNKTSRKLVCLSREPPPHFGCDHHEACTSPVANQLGICAPSFFVLPVLPSALKGDTKVVSIANWAPRHRGSSSAMISNRRPSKWLNAPRSRSRIVRTTAIEWTATPAPACREGNSKAKTAEKKQPEGLRCEGGLPERGQPGEWDGCEGATLRAQESLIRRAILLPGKLCARNWALIGSFPDQIVPRRDDETRTAQRIDAGNDTLCGLSRVDFNNFNDGAGHAGVPLVNHPNAIRPACPMGRVSQPHGAAEAQTSKTQREGGTNPGRVSDACGINKQLAQIWSSWWEAKVEICPGLTDRKKKLARAAAQQTNNSHALCIDAVQKCVMPV